MAECGPNLRLRDHVAPRPVIGEHRHLEPALVHRSLDVGLYLITGGVSGEASLRHDGAGHLVQRPDGVRKIIQLHIHVPRVVEHCPDHEQGRVVEVNVELRAVIDKLQCVYCRLN